MQYKGFVYALQGLLIILIAEANLHYFLDYDARNYNYLTLLILFPLYGIFGCGIELGVVLFLCYFCTKLFNLTSCLGYLAVALFLSLLLCLVSDADYILMVRGWSSFVFLVTSISGKLLIPTYVYWATVRPDRNNQATN